MQSLLAKTVCLAVAGALSLGMLPEAGAAPLDQKTFRESKSSAHKRTHASRQVSGTILATKSVSIRGTRGRNLVALLKTTEGDRRVLVDLGPRAALKGFDFARGKRLSTEGVVVRIRDAQFLVATRLRQEGRQLTIDRRAQLAQLHREQEDEPIRTPYDTPSESETGSSPTPKPQKRPQRLPETEENGPRTYENSESIHIRDADSEEADTEEADSEEADTEEADTDEENE